MRQLPLKIGMGLLLTGRQLTASEAHAWGLVNAVVAAGDLLDQAHAWAREVLACAPLAVRATKQAALQGMHLQLRDALYRNYDWVNRSRASQDVLEGPRAFAEKRKPQWQGR